MADHARLQPPATRYLRVSWTGPECPGPPYHDCTDRSHPLGVDVTPWENLAAGVPQAYTVPAGATGAVVQLVTLQ